MLRRASVVAQAATPSRRRFLAQSARGLAWNQVWAYGFVFDACASGQQLKCLAVIEEFIRECFALDVAGGIRSRRVIEALSRLISAHGTQRYLRSDNGPVFVSKPILNWPGTPNINTALSDPGKPWQKESNESFNGKSPDECLSTNWYRNRIDSKIVIGGWRRHYYEVRLPSSLGQLTPIEFKRTLSQANPEVPSPK